MSLTKERIAQIESLGWEHDSDDTDTVSFSAEVSAGVVYLELTKEGWLWMPDKWAYSLIYDDDQEMRELREIHHVWDPHHAVSQLEEFGDTDFLG